MLFRQLFEPETSTYTYLIADQETREAVIIDPVLENIYRDIRLLKELDLKLKWTLDTHVHADHITSSGILRDRCGAKSVASAGAGVPCVDVPASHGHVVEFGAHALQVRSTPGHTNGCVTYVLQDGNDAYAFTGDALLIRGCGRTDFQEGNSQSLFKSVREQIFSLPDHTFVYPGHDYHGNTVSTVGEEKAFNPRLNLDVDVDEFSLIMSKLDLADPKYMDVAIPANMACGRVERTLRFAEVYPQNMSELVGYRVIDVRQPAEFTGPLGHIEGSELVPLDKLLREAKEWDVTENLLFVCRSGNRSYQACATLSEMGFEKLTNMAGGMIAWNKNKETN